MRDENKDLKPTDREDPDKEYAKHEINGMPNPNPFDKLLLVIVKSKRNRRKRPASGSAP